MARRRIILIKWGVCIIANGCLMALMLMLMWTSQIPTQANKVEKRATRSQLTSFNESNLWKFEMEEDNVLFLYNKILSVPQGELNKTMIISMRKKLSETINTSSAALLSITQENAPLSSSLPFYLHSLYKGLKPAKPYVVQPGFHHSLPKTSPFKKSRFKTCSVVGNSGILKGSSCGKAIDTSDYVFRCNAAPLEPFATDAGIRSNLTTMNPSVLVARYDSLANDTMVAKFKKDNSKYNGFLWVPCFGISKFLKLCVKAMSDFNVSNPKLIIGHPHHFLGVYEFWNAVKSQAKPLSTGFYLISVALELCDEVNVFGFWPFPHQYHHGEFEYVPYHYFNDQKMTKIHSMNIEFSIILQMHLLRIINLHVGRCE